MGKGLTTKQLQILNLLAKGKTTKQIATILENSPYTIDNMRKMMTYRVGALNIANLIHIAHKRGWLK